MGVSEHSWTLKSTTSRILIIRTPKIRYPYFFGETPISRQRSEIVATEALNPKPETLAVSPSPLRSILLLAVWKGHLFTLYYILCYIMSCHIVLYDTA